MRGALIMSLATALASTTPQTGVLEVVANGKRCGDGLVAIADLPIAIEARLLEACGIDLRGLTRTDLDGASTIAVADLTPRPAELDPATLTVRIEVPVARWSPQDLSAGRVASARGHDEAPSLHLDVAPRATTAGLLELTAQAGVRAHGASLSSGLQASNALGVGRGLTRAVYDHLPTLLRFVAGDEVVGGSGLGSAAVIGGLTVRHTGALDPQRARGVALGIADVAETPSELEVYVNDGLVRRVRVEPGPFRIDDLAQPAGAGQVRYVLRDAYGAERVVSTPFFSSPGLLRPGEHEGAYSAGLVRDMRRGESWTYGAPALVFDHRFGSTRDLTLGGHLEASPLGARGGPSFLTSVAEGTLELALGLATSAQGPGAAGLATYTQAGALLSWSMHVRAAAPEYEVDPLAIAAQAVGDHALVRGGLALSLGLERWSVSVEAIADARGDGHAVGTVRAGASGNLVDGLAVYGGGHASTDGAWQAALGLRWSLDHGFGLSVDNDAQATTGTTQLRADRRMMGEEGWGASTRVAIDQRSGAVSGDASAQAQTRYGRIDVRGLVGPLGVEGMAQLSTSLIAVWGGGVFIAGRGSDGYALVEVPDQEGVRVYLDHREVGVTDGDGQLLVSGLRPYETVRLSIAPGDVSLDAVIAASELPSSVPPRGTHLLRFPVRRAQFVRGVVSRNGTPAKYGQLSARCGGAIMTSLIGSDGAFELDTPPSGVCQLDVVSEGRSCRGQIVVSGRESLLDVGTTACEEVAGP